MAAQCKFKEAKCYHCGTMGHIRCVCHQLMSSSEQDEVKDLQEASLPNEEYESYFQVGGDKRCKPFEVEVSIDGQPLRMKIDTGASVIGVVLLFHWCHSVSDTPERAEIGENQYSAENLWR